MGGTGRPGAAQGTRGSLCSPRVNALGLGLGLGPNKLCVHPRIDGNATLQAIHFSDLVRLGGARVMVICSIRVRVMAGVVEIGRLRDRSGLGLWCRLGLVKATMMTMITAMAMVSIMALVTLRSWSYGCWYMVNWLHGHMDTSIWLLVYG